MRASDAGLINTRVRHLTSRCTGQEYRITVALPYGHGRPEVTEWPFANPRGGRWPVVYLLDADWYFGMVSDTVRSMAWCGSTTDAIVVGIGYPRLPDPQAGWREAVLRRASDFTPVRDAKYEAENAGPGKTPPRTGSGRLFHAFLREQVIPLIEREYLADPTRRVLAGHSLGGLFAAFSLLHEPALFEAYVLGSPALDVCSEHLFGLEESLASEGKRLIGRAYVTLGELEADGDLAELFAAATRFAGMLQERRYEELRVVTEVLPNMNHCEVLAPGFQAALRWVLTTDAPAPG